jgi:hypothetical protein
MEIAVQICTSGLIKGIQNDLSCQLTCFSPGTGDSDNQRILAVSEWETHEFTMTDVQKITVVLRQHNTVSPGEFLTITDAIFIIAFSMFHRIAEIQIFIPSHHKKLLPGILYFIVPHFLLIEHVHV